MGIYRIVCQSFWNDPKVNDDFTPEDKYFMLYCLTNPYTNLAGCYEISIKQMSMDLGYTKEKVEKLIDRFITLHKNIDYDFNTKELIIKNWSKYNWTNSSKLDKPLKESIEKIKNNKFKKYLADKFNERNTVSIRY